MHYLVLLYTLFLSTALIAHQLDNIVIFGDSLSDNGNLYAYMQHKLPTSPPYYKGRFSDGRTWVEYLTQAYFPKTSTEHLLNYAFGGAVATEDPNNRLLFTLKREIDSYLLAHQEHADPNSLFIIWIGANNYLSLTEDSMHDYIVTDVTLSIVHGLQRLVNTGAKHILILNLPDLGQTPAARLFNVRTILTAYTQHHNSELIKLIYQLQQHYPQVQVMYYDVAHALKNILANPIKYGFTNVIDACYDVATTTKHTNQAILNIISNINQSQKLLNCNDYLYFDPIHPTEKMHKLLAISIQHLLKHNFDIRAFTSDN